MTLAHRISALACLAVAVAACGGPERVASPADYGVALTPRPVALAGSPGCPIDASIPLDRRAVVLLEEGPDTDAAARRWLVDTYGVLELDGYDSIEAMVPPEHVDGAALAESLRSQLEDSGVLELADGCYGASDPDSWSSTVTTIVIPHQGRLRQFALAGDDGPLALVRAVRLVRAYARAIALPYDAEAQRALALGTRGEPASEHARR